MGWNREPMGEGVDAPAMPEARPNPCAMQRVKRDADPHAISERRARAMTTDTTPLAPTDAELEAFAIDEQFLMFCDMDEFTQIARAVLDKWGQPAHSGEPVAWLDPWTGTKVTTDYDAYGKHGIPLYLAPPTVEQEPLTADEQDGLYWRLYSLSKSLEGRGRIDEYDTPDAYRTILDAMNALRDKKGGQHGAVN